MNGAIILLPFLAQIILCSAAVPPVTKCKLSDSDCVKNSAVAFAPNIIAGIPDIGTEPVDPMHLKEIKVELSGLNLLMNDVVITGLKDAKLQKVSVDMEKKQLKILLNSDYNLKGKYKASGKLLILPISGDGDATFDIKNLVMDITATFEVVKNSEGKDTMLLKSFNYDYEIKGGNHVMLTNLFNGNQALSDALHKFMDDNWKQLSEEFGRPLLDSTNKEIFKVIKKYLKSQPLEEISVP
ncbi:hypothetical protein ACJJTC_018788 [Scirpophaga incertulas]